MISGEIEVRLILDAKFGDDPYQEFEFVHLDGFWSFWFSYQKLPLTESSDCNLGYKLEKKLVGDRLQISLLILSEFKQTN